MTNDRKMTPKQVRFVDEYLVDLNATAAYKRAGYSGRSNVAESAAQRMLSNVKVAAHVAERKTDRLKRLELSQDNVLRDLFLVVMADARDLIEYHVGCCRYCHGDGFEYQRRPAEYRKALDEYMAEHGERDPAGLLFPIEGGVGFDARKPPRQDCPECHGRGVGRVVIHDTRDLNESAQALFAGVKETRHGIEIQMRSKDKAIELAARHTGLVKSTLEVGNKDGKPFQHAGVTAQLTTTDPAEAARIYQEIMGGSADDIHRTLG